MANGQGQAAGESILKRKAEAGRNTVAASRQITPGKALSTAIVQAADKRLEMVVSTTSSTARTGTLSELLETVPEGGLLAVLEGPGDAQGLMALDATMLSALIEKMMTGRLSGRPPTPRRPTRTDAALVADVIDDVLRRFEAPFLGMSTARWAAGFGYSSYLDDPRPLGLMLEDIDYRMLSLALDVEKGARSCMLLLALPADGRGPLGRPAEMEGGGDWAPAHPGGSRSGGAARAHGAAHSEPEPEEQLSWGDALERDVLQGRVSLDAVLHRFDLPIASLELLKPGLELPMPARVLDECAIVGADGAPIAQGRLGQSRSMRAVRLGASAAPAGADPSPYAGAAAEAQAAPMGEIPPFQGASIAMADTPLPGPLEKGPTPALPEIDDDDPLAGLPPRPDLPDLPGLPDIGDSGTGLPALPDLPSID
ncbi:MAG: FliM/FliN family flagellar motor C-terminal domain-containing protein [Pseudomonadota bacterium]